MILPDVNLLLHAYDIHARLHERAQAWWGEQLNSAGMIGLPWAVTLGFVRMATNRKIVDEPIGVDDACATAQGWLGRPNVVALNPGERHASLVFELLRRLGTAANLTTDAHLAALAIEHQCELQSLDTDFARFPGLRWRNPLAGTPATT